MPMSGLRGTGRRRSLRGTESPATACAGFAIDPGFCLSAWDPAVCDVVYLKPDMSSRNNKIGGIGRIMKIIDNGDADDTYAVQLVMGSRQKARKKRNGPPAYDGRGELKIIIHRIIIHRIIRIAVSVIYTKTTTSTSSTNSTNTSNSNSNSTSRRTQVEGGRG